MTLSWPSAAIAGRSSGNALRCPTDKEWRTKNTVVVHVASKMWMIEWSRRAGCLPRTVAVVSLSPHSGLVVSLSSHGRCGESVAPRFVLVGLA